MFESFAADLTAQRFFAVATDAGFFLDFREGSGELRRHVDLEGTLGMYGKVLERKREWVEHGEELRINWVRKRREGLFGLFFLENV